MKKKILMVVIAIILIALVALVAIGKPLMEKYSYSDERADLDAYFQVSGEMSAIILQDEQVEEQALVRDGVCYFDLDTVHKYMNEIFYADRVENLLLYTDATGTVSAVLDGNAGGYVTESGEESLGHPVCLMEGETVYVAADYVRLFTNYSYEVFDRHVQVYTQWGERQTAQIRKATALREKGGIKSPILRDMKADETVEILEQMETWSKVKTSDSMIGYVENKRLSDVSTEQETPVTDYVAPDYTGLPLAGKVSLGFHSIGGVGGNSTLYEMVSGSKGMNVIAPTWFSLCDEEGNFRSFGEKSYVDGAHSVGLQVWGVLDNFNYRNETGTSVDEHAVLSVTSKRRKLVNGITETAANLGLDGINIDFEQIAQETGEHYVQFLRELSVACRKNGLALSVDNYVPFHFNEHYRLDVQGEIADYVIIMGYDEHWHGSGDPGSVASIDYVTNGIAKTISEVPAAKVINALPFYTIVWTTNGADVTDEYLTMNNMAAFLNQVSAEPEWDETTCQNYLEWQSGSGLKQVWLEDADSIKVKLNVMSVNEIGGVAVWRLGYGTPAVWELINAYSSF
ncbi:MAG: glycosyl hydrolase family 18 protein [Clostridium sp.]|nr:glycosyl hydrolase family 18 protein [Acetatifactor muris]MCM1525837.1 glycosyl hydrolase family 18 protein [Bacteroides sp.]MCM1562623.1 glycosyl hydrolase family 18 protein [Clostridium sp.]